MPRVLDVLGGLSGWIPLVNEPQRLVPFREKLLWTCVTLLIFLTACQTPLYGIHMEENSESLNWLRMMMASNRGTLMELGIAPIVSTSMVVQFISNAQLIQVDKTNPRDRALLENVQKLAGLGMTFAQALAYVFGGMYGDVRAMGTGNSWLIVVQLTLSGLLVLMLDDLLTKYGLGAGISLFVATNICEGIFWQAFSPTTRNTGRGTEFRGAVLALVHLLLSRSNKTSALRRAFFRQDMPNVTNLLATVFIFVVVVYFQGWKVDIPIRNTKYRGQHGTYPIKLFYTSTTPVMLQSALVSNIYFFSQALARQFAGNFFVDFIGVWRTVETAHGARLMPVGGFAYYMSPPNSAQDIVNDPTHAVLYILFVLFVSAGFSILWLQVSGSSARDVSKRLKAQNLQIRDTRDPKAQRKFLNRYIPIAAAFGGMCVGALTVIANFLGAIGSGTGVLIAVSTIHQYYEEYAKATKREDVLQHFWS